jgi:hypothetical protein
MTWTYDGDLATDRDKVRWLSGDTDTSDQLITDEEIAYALTLSANVRYAAATVCEGIAAKFARKATTRVGDLSISWGDLGKQYSERADRLRRDAAYGAIPVAGGVSIARVESVHEDTDVPAPSFAIGMLDNPYAGSVTASYSNEDDD